MLAPLRQAVSSVESALDHIKLSYKWKFNRWDELQIMPYRGYGNAERIYVKGRVLDDKGAEIDAEHDSKWKSITNTIRRIETDEIPGAVVRLEVGDRSVEIETDDDGFFEAEVDLEGPLEGDGPWNDLPIELLKPTMDGEAVRAEVPVIIPYEDCEFAVVSDLDDTVIRTGATNKLTMFKTVLLNSAHTRAPFPGVAEFYRALTLGPDAKGHNPIFYVSSSPWNLYDMFETFMEVRDLPVGPIFLKNFGFTSEHFLSSGHRQHKVDRIEKLLEVYSGLSFILVGDSGQKDAEIYKEIVDRHPHRIKAIFIRDVTPDNRDRQIDAIAEELADQGVPMARCETTADAAVRAAELGLIPEDSVGEVRAAKAEEEKRSS